MKITLNPQITTLQSLRRQNDKEKQNNNQISKQIENRKVFAYQDFNISFAGRTPEDFYAQKFNRENMPKTMKEYLDYDEVERQHIPPQQMMQDAFRYLDYAESIEDVKKVYPNEDLFKNLHPLKLKARTGILSEINDVKSMSDTPLLKNGSDDFGLYILKKIYQEGKTLKEISKDFLEKDINDEYKGLITSPIDYSTTAAYGIKFPNNAFWHSFINTRDEYKAFFVTLPKHSVVPGVNLGNKAGKSGEKKAEETDNTDKIEKPRRHKIQKFKKEQLTKDIASSDMTEADVEKKIRRRFSKDDPEASFIVKYLSPIMTVAAAKVHLSEELKEFNDYEKREGKVGTETHMLKRFWKNHPELKTEYATAITDSIELFEDNYGAGGMLPINNEFQVINPSTKNQKAIDYVTPNFLDFINSIHNIEDERNKRYAEHDRLQTEWEEHLNTRYNTPEETTEEQAEIEDSEIPEKSTEDALREIAKKYNADIISVEGANGEEIYLTGNIEETFKEMLQQKACIYPSAFANLYVRSITKDPQVTYQYKFNYTTRQHRDQISKNEPLMMTDEALFDEEQAIEYNFYIGHADQTLAAGAAMADIMNKELDGDAPVELYKKYVHEYNYMMSHGRLAEKLPAIMKKNRIELDRKYSYYLSPLTAAERNKVEISMMEQLSKYNGNIGVCDPNITEVILMLKESIQKDPELKKTVRGVISCLVNEYNFSKCILDKTNNQEHKAGRFEQIMEMVIRDLLSPRMNEPVLVSIINRETLNRHKNKLTPETYARLLETVQYLPPLARQRFEDIK